MAERETMWSTKHALWFVVTNACGIEAKLFNERADAVEYASELQDKAAYRDHPISVRQIMPGDMMNASSFSRTTLPAIVEEDW